MKRVVVLLFLVLTFSGCNASKSPSFKVGDEVTFRNFAAKKAVKNWMPVDEQAFAEMGKPPAEFDKVFDQLVADGRIFQERNSARMTILATKNLGTKAARVRILEGDHTGREAWTTFSSLVPLPRP